MATVSEDESATRRQSRRSSANAACEACRKLKMRCIRPEPWDGVDVMTEPCERCKRNDRTCTIPRPRPLGRKPGAVGRYRGVDKALRLMHSELRKARESSGVAQSIDGLSIIPESERDFLELLPLQTATSTYVAGANHMPVEENSRVVLPQHPPSFSTFSGDAPPEDAPQPLNNGASPQTISNPLGLLADASEAAQVLEVRSASPTTSPSAPDSSNYHASPAAGAGSDGLARCLLRRPGYVSLGLKLSNESLEHGLDTLFTAERQEYRYSHYFKPPASDPARDTGPDVDPIDLGLISMDTAYYLFPIYFARLHPINGILDPILHTPEFVRSRSALLFTWILAITSQFDHASGSVAIRLRLHGEKLSKRVHTCGYKSVEIVQGYYISLLSATPAATMANERSWLYTTHAFGLAAELGLDQGSRSRDHLTSGMSVRASTPNRSPHLGDSMTTASRGSHRESIDTSQSRDPFYSQRLARNRERTWLRILLWERANSAACGRMNTFPETELTLHVDNWWLHPLADPTDKYTCAFILLRRHLSALHNELKSQAGLPHNDHHWVRELVNAGLEPWCQTWLSSPDAATMSPSDHLSSIFLRYVYKHGRLWTLSFALHGSIHGDDDSDAIAEDCFNAAVNCCEIAVRDLQEIGEPLYCMLAPTWAMISYAAVLTLKLFPSLHGARPGSEVELLALLSQVSIQLERAGTTPPQRFGIAALLGQHLLMILRTRATVLRETFNHIEAGENMSFDQDFESHVETSNGHIEPSEIQPYDPMLFTFDPFLASSSTTNDGDLSGDNFAEILRDLFGQGFGGMT